jgi:hypothetical protein
MAIAPSGQPARIFHAFSTPPDPFNAVHQSNENYYQFTPG